MTRKELVQETALNANMAQWQVDRVITAVLDTIREALKNGDDVRIREFGRLECRQRKPRRAYNFATGESVMTAPSMTIHFVPSANLCHEVNDQLQSNDPDQA